MRILGHPLHVMLIHFPVALWPAHAGLHLLSRQLPAGVAGAAGFWLLLGGTVLGWFAAGCGLIDLLALPRADDRERLADAFCHALLNGSVLVGFSCLCAVEYPNYPGIAHGPGFLAVEVALLLVLGVGNYFGGAIVWRKATVSGPVKR